MAISHSFQHLHGQDWQFHHCFQHLVVTFGNFTLLLTSSGQQWQFHFASDINGQVWQFHIAIDI